MSEETAVLSHDELEQKLAKAAQAGDYKLVRQIARELEESEKTEAKAKKERQLTLLAEVTSKVKAKLDAIVNKMVDSKELDDADGVWYSFDFGSTDTACRLTKSAPRKSSGNGGSGSYVSHPAKTSDLLTQVGGNVIFAEETEVTIDKVKHNMPAGMTFKEAYDLSNNGGWRNRIRMALLKEAGLV